MNKIDTFPSVLHFFFFFSFQHGIILFPNVFVGSMHMTLSMPPSLWWRGEHTRQCLGGGLTLPAPFTFSMSVGEAGGWFVAVKVQPSCEFSERQQRCFFSSHFPSTCREETMRETRWLACFWNECQTLHVAACAGAVWVFCVFLFDMTRVLIFCRLSLEWRRFCLLVLNFRANMQNNKLSSLKAIFGEQCEFLSTSLLMWLKAIPLEMRLSQQLLKSQTRLQNVWGKTRSCFNLVRHR